MLKESDGQLIHSEPEPDELNDAKLNISHAAGDRKREKFLHHENNTMSCDCHLNSCNDVTKPCVCIAPCTGPKPCNCKICRKDPSCPMPEKVVCCPMPERVIHRLHLKIPLDQVQPLQLPCFRRSKMVGLSSIEKRNGKVKLQEAIRNKKVHWGPAVAKDHFDKHYHVSIDLGFIDEISMAIIYADCDDDGNFELIFVSKQISSVCKYSGSGVDQYLREKKDAMEHLAKEFEALKEVDRRSTDPEIYEEFKREFQEAGNKIIDFNYTHEELKRKKELDNRKRSHWSTVANIILAFVEAMEERSGKKDGNPVIVMGIPTFKATMKGKRACSPKKTVEFISRFFTLIMIGEYLTSQRCPLCFGFLRRKFKESTRIWECPSCKVDPSQRKRTTTMYEHIMAAGASDMPDEDYNSDDMDTSSSYDSNPGDSSDYMDIDDDGENPTVEKVPFVVNKDVSAAINIFLIFISLLWTGERPIAFQPRKKVLADLKALAKKPRQKKKSPHLVRTKERKKYKCLFFVFYSTKNEGILFHFLVLL